MAVGVMPGSSGETGHEESIRVYWATPVDRESTEGSRRKEVRIHRICTVGHEFVEGRPFARFPAVRTRLHDSGQFIEVHGQQNGKSASLGLA